MGKLYTRSARLVCEHLSLPNTEKDVVVSVVSALTEPDTTVLSEIKSDKLLELAQQVKTIRFVSDLEAFRRLERASLASDVVYVLSSVFGTVSVAACVYTVRDDTPRLAVHLPAYPIDFAVNVTDSPTYARQCMNSPVVTKDFSVEIPSTSKNAEMAWRLEGYHTQSSDVQRYLVLYTQEDINIPLSTKQTEAVKPYAVEYVPRTEVFNV